MNGKGQKMREIERLIRANNGIPVASLDVDYINENTDRLYEEITTNKIPNHANTLRTDIRNGLILELGISKMIGGQYNNKQHDFMDWETYAYDISKGDQLIEIKRNNPAFQHYNINIKKDIVKGVNYGKYSYYDTYFKHYNKLDYLITGYVQDGKIYAQYLIDSPNYMNYVRRSKFTRPNGNSTHYFDVRSAKARGHLIEF